MQIICNNCGNELDFPNRQVYVTCSHCYTHLQIEEHDNRIFATIIEAKDIDHSIFQSTDIIKTDLPNALYDLLHLEGEHDETLEETAFYYLTQRAKNRPMRFRAVYRLLISAVLLLIFFLSLHDIINHPPTAVFGIIVCIILVFYWFTITKGGIQELRKGIELRRFDKYYVKERSHLLTKLEDENLSNAIRQAVNELSDNYDADLDIIEEFFYVELLKSIRIKLGAPSISKGLRIFAVGIPAGLAALGFGLSGYPFAFLFAGLAIVSVFFGFFVLGDSNEYKRVRQINLTKRTAILDKLRRLMR